MLVNRFPQNKKYKLKKTLPQRLCYIFQQNIVYMRTTQKKNMYQQDTLYNLKTRQWSTSQHYSLCKKLHQLQNTYQLNMCNTMMMMLPSEKVDISQQHRKYNWLMRQ
jgi:Tfp pilus assembly pilus retraction ATPase PilT